MFAFSKYTYVVIIAEAEVIKEKVKPAPVKKGIDVNKIILKWCCFPMYGYWSLETALL